MKEKEKKREGVLGVLGRSGDPEGGNVIVNVKKEWW